MVLSECYGFSKYALVCVNLIIGSVGLVLVMVSICMVADQTYLVSMAQGQQHLNAGLYILVALGNLMLSIAFVGCYGAFRESRFVLVGFFSCLLVIIVTQVGAGVWLYANRVRLQDLVKTSVIHTVKNVYGEDTANTQMVDVFQSGLGCCGATGPADWAGSKYASKDSLLGLSLTVSTDASVYTVPETCCIDKNSTSCEIGRNIKVAGIISPAIYSEGCIEKLIAALNSQGYIVIGVAIGIGILEFLSMVFCLILFCAIGSSDRYKA